MKIFYFYEFAGIEKKYQQNLIEIDEKVLKCLAFEHLQKLLIEDRASINENSVLCYFNEAKKVYVALKQGETMPVSDQIKISIRGGYSSDISEFWQKLDSLAHQAQISEEKLEVKEKEQSKPVSKKKSINSSYFELDIAMLHAAPLACHKKYGILPYEEGSLDFETEKKFLLENLAEGIGADLRFEAATTENLDELLEYMPKIIIISCQSYYEKTKKEFVLAFENHDLSNDGKGEIGLLYEMNTQNLKKILKASNQYLQIVIVKGWFSQEIGKVLLSAGFSCVITVHDKFNDPDSLKFIVSICNNLLKGLTVEESFKNSEKSSETSQSSHCCCAHQHKPFCLWAKKARVLKTNKRHEDHSSHDCCSLEGSRHELLCYKAKSFNAAYCNSRPPTPKEIEQGYWTLCCCSEEIDHSQLKFSILSNDERVLSQVLFNSNKKNKIEERSALSTHLKPLCAQKFTVARRLEIREILLMSLQSRCINVIGPCGIGKTMVLKRVAQYAYERRIFKDGVVYLDFLKTTDIIFLYRYIANTLNLHHFNNTKDLCAAINNLDILLIIDNIDLLIKQDPASLIECYNDILLNTIKPKFLIASRLSLNLQRSKAYSMPDLSILQAISLLKQLNSDKQLKNIPEKIFERIGTKPSDILQISPLVSQENYENLIENEEVQDFDKIFCSLSVSLKFINDKIPNSQNFFKVLCYLPSGALKVNMKYLCEDLFINYEEVLQMLKSQGTWTWFIDSENNFELILLRSNVADYFECRVPKDPKIINLCLVHLASFARGILIAFLDSEASIGAEIRSSLFFVNAGIQYGMWKAKFLNERLNGEITDPYEMFTKIEPNFWYYINKSQGKRLLFIENSFSEELGKALEEIMLCTISILIILGKHLDAIEMIYRSKVFCKEFRLKKVQNMLKLVEASLKSSMGEYTFSLELVDSAKSYFLMTQDFEGQAECHLLKGLIKEALDSKNELILSKSQSIPTDAEGQFELAEKFFIKADQSLGCARAKLALAQYKLKSRSNETQILNSLVFAIEVFNNLDFVFWETSGKICLSDWYFHGHNWLEAKENLTSIVFRKKDVQHEIIISSKLRKLHEIIQRTKKLEKSLFEDFSEEKLDKHPINAKSFDRCLNEAVSLEEPCGVQDGKIQNLESNDCSYIEVNNPRECDILKEQEQRDFGTVLKIIPKYKSY